ncbi:hypothetical protein [Streptomyces sp. NPDC054863]
MSFRGNGGPLPVVWRKFTDSVGFGAGSRHLETYDTSTAPAELLGTPTAEFPGDHAGFLGQPEEFAEGLRKVLAG